MSPALSASSDTIEARVCSKKTSTQFTARPGALSGNVHSLTNAGAETDRVDCSSDTQTGVRRGIQPGPTLWLRRECR
jgi:hypothetical protein